MRKRNVPIGWMSLFFTILPFTSLAGGMMKGDGSELLGILLLVMFISYLPVFIITYAYNYKKKLAIWKNMGIAAIIWLSISLIGIFILTGA